MAKCFIHILIVHNLFLIRPSLEKELAPQTSVQLFSICFVSLLSLCDGLTPQPLQLIQQGNSIT